MSRPTYEKARAVVHAAEADPTLRPLVDEMNATGKVDRAFKKVKATTEPEPKSGDGQSPDDDITAANKQCINAAIAQLEHIQGHGADRMAAFVKVRCWLRQNELRRDFYSVGHAVEMVLYEYADGMEMEDIHTLLTCAPICAESDRAQLERGGGRMIVDVFLKAVRGRERDFLRDSTGADPGPWPPGKNPLTPVRLARNCDLDAALKIGEEWLAAADAAPTPATPDAPIVAGQVEPIGPAPVAGALLDAALAYAELGYMIFPCRPESKIPLTAHGLLDATTDPEKIVAWWTATPTANVAIVTQGMVVVDVDKPGNPWLADQPDRAAELLAAPLATTPRKGRHFLFRQPATGGPWRNTAGKIAPNVDTRADGGYIVAPPSILAGGKGYQWINPLDAPPDQLPILPEWLAQAINPTSTTTGPSDRADRPVVANQIPEGQRNDALARLAGNMRRAGMGEREIAAALRVTNAERCTPPISPAEVDQIAASVARYEPDQITVAVVENHFGQMVGQAEDLDPIDRAPHDPGEFPAHFLDVPGFLAQYLDYANCVAHRRQPVLALAGGLALLATITGRKVVDPTGTRTNLYVLGVAHAGSGKERPRKINKELLHAAGMAAMAGPEDLASHAGLISAIEKQPAILFQLDEIGLILRTIRNARAAPHLAKIPGVLMSLFTSSDSVFACPAYAEIKKNRIINQPHACLYGTTVPESFYEGMTAESLSNGFYARLLVFETPTRPKLLAPEMVPPPAELVETVRYWGDFRSAPGNLTAENPKPAKIDYTPEAVAIMAEFGELADACQMAPGSVNAVWARAVEKARKLAMLYAASRDHRRPVVDVTAAEWAIALVDYLTQRMINVAHFWVAESKYDETRLRVLRVIRDAGPGGLSKRELTRRTRQLPIREREDIVAGLLASAEIREAREQTGGRRSADTPRLSDLCPYVLMSRLCHKEEQGILSPEGVGKRGVKS